MEVVNILNDPAYRKIIIKESLKEAADIIANQIIYGGSLDNMTYHYNTASDIVTAYEPVSVSRLNGNAISSDRISLSRASEAIWTATPITPSVREPNLIVGNLTELQRRTGFFPELGQMVYNPDTNTLSIYVGGRWETIRTES